MPKSIANKPAGISQRLKGLLGQTSFVVTLCAALALVLGAISVGAVSYVAREPSKPVVSTPPPQDESAPAPPAHSPAPKTQPQQAAHTSPPVPSTPEPAPAVPKTVGKPHTIAQPPDRYVPIKPELTIRGSVSVSLNSRGLQATVQTPPLRNNPTTTIAIPTSGKPRVSLPTLTLPLL